MVQSAAGNINDNPNQFLETTRAVEQSHSKRCEPKAVYIHIIVPADTQAILPERIMYPRTARKLHELLLQDFSYGYPQVNLVANASLSEAGCFLTRCLYSVPLQNGSCSLKARPTHPPAINTPQPQSHLDPAPIT